MSVREVLFLFCWLTQDEQNNQIDTPHNDCVWRNEALGELCTHRIKQSYFVEKKSLRCILCTYGEKTKPYGIFRCNIDIVIINPKYCNAHMRAQICVIKRAILSNLNVNNY